MLDNMVIAKHRVEVSDIQQRVTAFLATDSSGKVVLLEVLLLLLTLRKIDRAKHMTICLNAFVMASESIAINDHVEESMIDTHQLIKVGMMFSHLDDDQEEPVAEFLRKEIARLIANQIGGPLVEFLMQRLGLVLETDPTELLRKQRYLFDDKTFLELVEPFFWSESKNIVRFLVPQEFTEEQIVSAISQHYEAQGFTVSYEHWAVRIKKDGKLYISVFLTFGRDFSSSGYNKLLISIDKED